MNEIVKYPKLPKVWKRKFLEALRNKCYKFTKGDWYRSRRNSKTQQVETSYCTLGAAYHFSTGENKGRYGYTDSRVPEAFHNPSVRAQIINLNDEDSNRSFKKTADWIEKNL